jgi:drug/metabolite transporter (DMT)-like permease
MNAPAAPGVASSSLVGSALVFLSAVGFSIKAILIKVAYGHGVDATTLLALRMLFSAPFFIAMALWTGTAAAPASVTGRDWRMLVLLGLTGYYLATWLDFLGLQYIAAGLERLILFLYPTIVVLLSAWLFRERIQRRQLAALALSYGGIALVFAEQFAGGVGDSRDIALGGALVFASAVVYSVYLIGSSKVVHRFGAVRFTAWAMLAATAVALGQFFATHRAAALLLPMPVYAICIAMAIFATVLPAVFMSEGLRRIGANRAALVASVGPVVTLALGHAFLDETVGLLQVAGAALVLTGVLLVSVARTPGRDATRA